jgi:hypothetical protein
MRKNLYWFILSTVLLFLTACSELVVVSMEYKNVARVFWHENTKYSVLVRKNTELSVVSFPANQCMDGRKYKGEGVKIFADVPPREVMWVQMQTEKGENCFLSLTIHVHNESDIHGSEWNHGKFGVGQTTVIK